MRKRFTHLWMVLLFVGALSIAQAQTNLLPNPSFENPDLSAGGFLTVGGGNSIAIPGWTSLGTGAGYAPGEVVLIDGGGSPAQGADGTQFINLNGGAGPGGIRTTNMISLTPGGIYRLRFAMSGLPNISATEPRYVNVRVQKPDQRLVDEVFVFDPNNYPNHSLGNLVWVYYQVDFIVPVSVSAGWNVLFRSNNILGPDGNPVGVVNLAQFTGPFGRHNIAGGPLIDDVSLVQLGVIPEPSTMALFGAGLLGLLAARRRKA